MKIEFVKDCGHRKEGEVLECSASHGEQYISGDFAVPYVKPVPEPEPPTQKKEAKKVAKPKAKKV